MPNFDPSMLGYGSSGWAGQNTPSPPASGNGGQGIPAPPASGSSPGFDVSPPGGLGTGSQPPAPQLPGSGSGMTVPQNGQTGMGGGMTMNMPAPKPQTTPGLPGTTPAPFNQGRPGLPGYPQSGSGGLTTQPGVSGLGPLLQLLQGGGGASGSNPIMSLLQMLAQRQPGTMPQQGSMPTNIQGILGRSQGWVNNRMDPNWVAQHLGGGSGGQGGAAAPISGSGSLPQPAGGSGGMGQPGNLGPTGGFAPGEGSYQKAPAPAPAPAAPAAPPVPLGPTGGFAPGPGSYQKPILASQIPLGQKSQITPGLPGAPPKDMSGGGIPPATAPATMGGSLPDLYPMMFPEMQGKGGGGTSMPAGGINQTMDMGGGNPGINPQYQGGGSMYGGGAPPDSGSGSGTSLLQTLAGMQNSPNPMLQAMAPLLMQQLMGRQG